MAQRLRSFCRRCVAFLPVFVLSTAVLFSGSRLIAQVVNGIHGTVVDSTGAVIAGAHVAVTNNATGVVSSVVSSSEGTFTIVGLNPGPYSLTVDAAQFKRVQMDVTVEVAKISTLSFQMVPGSASQTVEVKGSAISLETTEPVIGATLEPELVKTAPIEINGLARQIDSFMFLAPGVQGTATSHNIDGGLTFENAVQFNGVPVAFVEYSGNQTYINPPYEAVSEFRVNSSTFDARYGLGQGAVTYQMASGTNQFHGDGFEILRNQFFDSVGFFPSHFGPTGNPIPPVDQQNNYGFTLGGPVVLPKVYNGKNRTFFHFSADWFKQNQAQTAIGTVPTVAMKNGDFSGFVDSTGKQIPIYDPTTGLPFPGNIIPQSRFSPLAKSILPLIPNPNSSGIVSGLQSNELPAVSSIPIRQTLWAYTIDHNLSNSQTIHFSQWRDSVNSPTFASAPIVPIGNPLQSETNNTQLGSGWLLNYVKTINSNLVMTAGADWIGSISGQTNAKLGVNFPGVVNSTTFPAISFDGQNAPTGWGVSSGQGAAGGLNGGLTVDTSRKLGIVLVNNWLWNKGRHTFNIGGEFRRAYQDVLACADCGGSFAFSQRTTSIPDPSDPNFGSYGSSFASFLLGGADGATRIEPAAVKLRSNRFATYIQDDIKVNKRLTLNVGLRWDVMVPFTENNNNIVYMGFTDPQSPCCNATLPTVLDPAAGNLPGGASKFGNCAGCAGITRAAIHWKNLQPGVGFSYMVNSKTVIRSGFYMTYLDGGASSFGTTQVGFYYASLLSGELVDQPNGTTSPAYGNWDANPLPVPAATPFSPSVGNGNIIMGFNPKTMGRAPVLNAWNLGVQRQLPWNMFLSVAYVGNRANDLPSSLLQPDQPPTSVLKYGSLLGELVTSPDAVAAGIKIPYPGFVQQFGSSATVIRALGPFPQYSAIYNTFEMDATSFYNALQVQGEKRFSNGLSYLADFTLSRNLANESVGSSFFQNNSQDGYNQKSEFTPSSTDQKYITNIATTYELPTGYGKKYLNSRGVLGQVLGGWQISALLTYAGGFPMGPFNNNNPLLTNFNARPDVVPGVEIKTLNYGLSKAYFEGKTATPPVEISTNAFVNLGPWQLGNAVRSYASLRTPPLREENFALMKHFHVTEGIRATLRVDYFNAFNRTQLQAPDMNSLDATFGQITNLSSQISNRQGQATFRLEF
jgi:hypothetical protein